MLVQRLNYFYENKINSPCFFPLEYFIAVLLTQSCYKIFQVSNNQAIYFRIMKVSKYYCLKCVTSFDLINGFLFYTVEKFLKDQCLKTCSKGNRLLWVYL